MQAPFPDNFLIALGQLDPTWFVFAFMFILLDLLSGFIIKGVLQRNVSSSIMREGLKHKSWEVSLILCATLVDMAINAGMDIGIQPVSSLTCGFISVMEAASICENALEGNPELANAPVIKYVSQAAQVSNANADDSHGKHTAKDGE